jgi:uncharacterized protein with von Willebrand factor type A (vWA) domain
MLIDLFLELRKARLPVSLNELLVLIEGLRRRVAFGSLDDFYYLARATLIKNEAHLDRFDRVFGAYGYHPEGVRIGQHESRQRRAVKVWERREFRNLDDTVELGTCNVKLALRRLRRFARQGAASSSGSSTTTSTTSSTSRCGGTTAAASTSASRSTSCCTATRATTG